MKPEAVVKYLKKLQSISKELCPSKTGVDDFLLQNAAGICSTPFSVHKSGPCCFAGGLILHTLNTIQTIQEVRKTYFSHIDKESAVFCAIFHGMWRIGDESNLLYEEQTDSYWRGQRGFLYKENENARFFADSDRTLYLLNKHGIPCSPDEWLAIRNYGGAFHKTNYSYSGKYSDLETLVQIAVQLTTNIEVRYAGDLEKRAEEKIMRSGD